MLLVRHARAGERDEWTGNDRLRPLDERGRAQAAALPELLADLAISGILSSPADRCVQTVEPLAKVRGIEVVVREELWEDMQSSAGMAVVRRLLATDAVVSCHGGLAEALTGESQKKGEALVLDEHGRVIERRRP